MTKMRRFPDDEAGLADPDEEVPRHARKRPADKRWKRPVSDKSSRPGTGASTGDTPDVNDR